MPHYGSLSTNKKVQDILSEIEESFRKWNVTQWDAPHAVKVGGVDATVRFVINGETKVLACSRFATYATNLLAISLTLASLRLASQRGILEQFRQFFKELPPGRAAESPWEILGIREGVSLAVAEAAYRTLAQSAHPDRGGLAGEMARLNQAIDSIRTALKGG